MSLPQAHRPPAVQLGSAGPAGECRVPHCCSPPRSLLPFPASPQFSQLSPEGGPRCHQPVPSWVGGSLAPVGGPGPHVGPPTASGKAPRSAPSQSFKAGTSGRTYRPGDLLHLSLALQPRARRSPRPPCGTSPPSCRREKTPWRAPAPPGSRRSAARRRPPPRRAPRTPPIKN